MAPNFPLSWTGTHWAKRTFSAGNIRPCKITSFGKIKIQKKISWNRNVVGAPEPRLRWCEQQAFRSNRPIAQPWAISPWRAPTGRDRNSACVYRRSGLLVDRQASESPHNPSRKKIVTNPESARPMQTSLGTENIETNQIFNKDCRVYDFHPYIGWCLWRILHQT